MHTIRTMLASLLMVPLALASPAFAQTAAVRLAPTPQALAAAVQQHAADRAADRAAIREALGRPEVRSAAARMGVDLDRVSTAAGTLTGADLTRTAAAARRVNHALVGGASTVTLSTTTIIIGLLILILLVVAVK